MVFRMLKKFVRAGKTLLKGVTGGKSKQVSDASLDARLASAQMREVARLGQRLVVMEVR